MPAHRSCSCKYQLFICSRAELYGIDLHTLSYIHWTLTKWSQTTVYLAKWNELYVAVPEKKHEVSIDSLFSKFVLTGKKQNKTKTKKDNTYTHKTQTKIQKTPNKSNQTNKTTKPPPHPSSSERLSLTPSDYIISILPVFFEFLCRKKVFSDTSNPQYPTLFEAVV